MRKTFFLGIILGSSLAVYHLPASTAPALSQQPCSASDEAAIHKLAAQWKDGYNQGDAAGVAALYAEDAYYLTQHFITGIVHGRPAVQAYVQRGADARYHVDSIEILSTGCSGGLAYSIGRYESTNAGQKAFGVNLVVLKRIDNRWLIVAHESAVPDPATAIQSLEIKNPR
jgi:uncharacterized protein (TIGR02246 family)